MCIVMLVTYTESTADMLAVAEMVGKELTPDDLARGLATDGLSSVLAGFMNSFPDTAYAENVGLIEMTKVRSRWVVATCGGFLLLLGLLPKVGALVAALPGPGDRRRGDGDVRDGHGDRHPHPGQGRVSTDNHNLLIVAVSLSVGHAPGHRSRTSTGTSPTTSRSSSARASPRRSSWCSR